MEYNIGKSNNGDAALCVQEATAKFQTPKLILYFSPVKNFEVYTSIIHEKFPNSICMGTTAIASFGKDGAEKNTLRVIGIESGISCSADVLEDIDKYPIKYVERVEKCARQIKSTKNSICLEFTTALLCAEESVLSVLNSVLIDKGIPVFGGTAGNDGTGTETKVALNGVVCERSCVFALIHNEGGAIHLYRENIYTPANEHVLTVTKADSQTRTVYEYNSRPAVKVYAEELGVPENRVKEYFDTHPVGRVIGDDMFITANCALTQDQRGIVYHARVYDNSKVMLLKPDNYREIVQHTMQKIKQEVPRPSLSIMCHCLARTLLFDNEGYLNQYAGGMADVLGNYIGFSGYGEQCGEHNFNQTMIVAVFE